MEWANGRRDALRRRWLDLLTRLATLQEVRGAPGVAVSLLERVVGAEPLEEEAHASLMRLYALSGRRHLAVRQYQAAVRGAEPGAGRRAAGGDHPAL